MKVKKKALVTLSLLCGMVACEHKNGGSGNSAALSSTSGYCESIYSSDRELSLAVCNAAYMGQLDNLKALVESKKPDLNAADSDGYRPLDVAYNTRPVYWQPLPASVITYLVSKGANPNTPLVGGGLALSGAAYMGDIKLVTALVEAGANVNAANSAGSTALHSAASCDFRLSSDEGAKATIEFLLSRGANILAKNVRGKSALESMNTPCAYQPELCAADKIEQATWPTGSCKETYLIVKKATEAAEAKK